MDLQEIREHLDRIDKTIVFMLAERMSLIPKVAEYKKTNGVERFQPEREKEIMQSKRALAEELNLNPDLVEDLFKRIILDAHRIEEKIIGE